jgi:hypothetical protein
MMVDVRTTDGDDEEWDSLARQLRREMLALDVDDVTVARPEDIAAGAKGDPITIGTLIVTASSAALTAACQLVRIWTTRDQGRKAIIHVGTRTLEITGANSTQQQQLSTNS